MRTYASSNIGEGNLTGCQNQGLKPLKLAKNNKMSKKVYVQNKDGTPLMPCKPAKARHLLRDEKAEVVKKTPFTIRLNWIVRRIHNK